MCGVVGFTGELSDRAKVVANMAGLLAHRGPDDAGCWLGDGIALGHRRLAIIDAESRSAQPFHTEDGAGVLSYNGELYNFRELRAELVADGVRFTTQSDTEVVLAALHHWGPERATPRFEGMFAFAYFDARDNSLWLARDRMAIKPMYIARVGDELVFGSEPKALFAHPQVRRSVSEVSICTLVLAERFESEMSVYGGVEPIAPGTLYHYQSGAMSCVSFFDVLEDVDAHRIIDGARQTHGSLAKTLEDKLRAAVRSHMVSDTPVATMCSGGFDSSLVTAMAREVNPDIVGYVADIEGMEGVEVERAKVAAGALGIELRVVDVTAQRYFEAVPLALAANDQPLFFPQDVAGMLVAQDIAADGYKVALTGDGADETFGGYNWHQEAYLSWQRRGRQLRWVKDSKLMRLLGRLHPNLRPRQRTKLEQDPLWPEGAFPLRFGVMKAGLIGGSQRRLREARLFEKLSGLPSDADRAFLTRSFEDVYVHMRERLATLDRLAMRYSLETRVPFLDNDVIDFGLHLPVSAKFHKGHGKVLVRALAKKFLPAELINLPKIGFKTSRSLWAGTHRLLLESQLADLLRWPRADRPKILETLAPYQNYLTRLVMLELWLRCEAGERPDELSERLLSLRR